MILFALAMQAAAAPGDESAAMRAEQCYTIATSGEEVETVPLPGPQVIERTSGGGAFAIDRPDVEGIMCLRPTIVPSPNDWKVVDAGYPLSIVEISAPADDRRVGVVEVADERFRFRIVGENQLTEDEEELVVQQLNFFLAAAITAADAAGE
jgi:uncharacterized membrane protein